MKIQGPNPEQSALEIIGDELQKSLDSAQKNAIFRVTVGYISDSGLSKLEKPLKKIIAQGGTVEVIVGLNQISKRSVRALDILFNICGGIGVFVFWNPNINVTFHPKCYILSNSKGGKNYVWIGSSNFTKQGLFSNYECNIHFVLDPKKDSPFITEIEEYYSKIRKSDFCHALDLARLSQLKNIKGIPNGEKPAVDSNKINEQIKIIFGVQPKVTLPKKAFVMTLSKNDIDGKRGEPYFLIPLSAMQQNKIFWGWPLQKSSASVFPSTKIQTKIIVSQQITVEDRRIYFVGSKTELRFVSPKIYRLGMSFLGSILLIQTTKKGYQIEVVNKQDKRFALLLKKATYVASNQKMWGYI